MTTLKIADICLYLRPKGGWATNGDNYESITFFECDPFTESEYEAAIPLAQAALDKASFDLQATKKAAIAKLAALGLDLDDLKSLGF